MTSFRQQQAKKIIFVFVITTLISSLSAAAFVTSNMNLALAKKSSSNDNGDSGGGNKDKGSGSSGGGSDNNGGGGSDNNNGGTASDNTAAPSPPTTDETTQTPPTAENQQTNTCPDGSAPDPTSGKCPTPSDNSGGTGSTPPPTNQQTNTCPDGSAPDPTSGKCPTSSQTLAPNQPPAAQDGGHILVMPNPDGTCPVGSHKFPGSQVCEKDAVTPSSSGGGQIPPECQGIIAGPSDKCSLGATGSPTSPINASPLTPQQQYENCLKGIGGGIPGNCKPPTPTSTEQNNAPLQTLTPQQTCKDGSAPNANDVCQDGSAPQQTCKGGEVLTDKGNCVSPGESQAIKNGTLVDIGNGKFELGTRPPVPNTNTIAPICPSDSHLVGSKCVVNGAGCPPGTVQDDGDITCSPFKQVEVPANPDGTCPEGSYSVGSSGNAGQPGTGSIFCLKNVPVETPPAGLPSNTPPAQPSQQKQLVPTETLTQRTCPPLPIDANGNCPGVDMRGGGLGLPPTPSPPPVTPVEVPANPDGSCPGVFDPPTNKCYHDNFHAPHCPGKPAERNNIGIERSAMGFCDDPQTGLPVPVLSDNADGTCEGSGVHIATRHGACFVDSSIVSDELRNPDGSCKTGYIATGNQCSLRIHDPLPDGTCPAGYRKIAAPTAPVPGGVMCKNNLDNNPDRATNELPGGYCPAGYKHVSLFLARYCQLE